MIIKSQHVFQFVTIAFENYKYAKKAKANLNHQSVFEYCKEVINNIAISSYLLVNETDVNLDEALNWVRNLPIPNGLFPMLIQAVNELSDRSMPFFNYILSLPTSISNMLLVKDALVELLDNIEKRDEEESFTESINFWRNQL